MEYFVNKSYEKSSFDGKYYCYYAYDTVANRLFQKKRSYIEEVTGSEKRRILNGYKKYIHSDECDDHEFYTRIERACLKSSTEETAVSISFSSDPFSFKKEIESLENVESFICDGISLIDEKLARYLASHQECGTLLIEALRNQWTHQYVNDNVSNDDGCLKTAFAVDVKHFIEDKFFDNDEDKLISWLKKVILKRNALNEDIVYLTGYDTQKQQSNYYVYDKINDRVYQKGCTEREIVSLAKMNVLNKGLNVVDKSKCEDPEFYKRIRRFPVYASDERKDVFLEFSDANGAKKFDKSFESLQTLKDFLEKEVKHIGQTVAHMMASSSLMFMIMYNASSAFYWYISKENVYNDDGLRSDFADSAVKFIMARFSLDVEDFLKIFKEIFYKLKMEEENEYKVCE